MKDREFLIWIHERLHEVHGESEREGHMHKLRAIITAMDKDIVTKNTAIFNSMEDLTKDLDLELLRCPLCGATAEFNYYSENEDCEDGMGHVKCTNVKCGINVFDDYPSAVKKWNTRPA